MTIFDRLSWFGVWPRCLEKLIRREHSPSYDTSGQVLSFFFCWGGGVWTCLDGFFWCISAVGWISIPVTLVVFVTRGWVAKAVEHHRSHQWNSHNSYSGTLPSSSKVLSAMHMIQEKKTMDVYHTNTYLIYHIIANCLETNKRDILTIHWKKSLPWC